VSCCKKWAIPVERRYRTELGPQSTSRRPPRGMKSGNRLRAIPVPGTYRERKDFGKLTLGAESRFAMNQCDREV